MKTIKKIITVISLIVLSLGLFACNKEDNNNSNNDTPPNGNIILPDIEAPNKGVKEEIIYIDIKQDGEVENIKASNKLTNTEFSYYEDYGYFLSKGNLNITSPLGEIVLPEELDKALIPSLDEHESFYYILALEKEKYQNRLPFNIEIVYKLENDIVSYSDLIGASGNVEIKILFTPNPDANSYFKDYFGAQIQIPLSTEHAKLINAENALTKTLAGKTLTLAYMAMPGQELEINLKIKAKNFKFDGIQATYQQFDVNELINNFIDLDGFDLSELTELETGINMIISQFINAKEGEEGLDAFFSGLEDLLSLSELLNPETFSELDELISGLTDGSFQMGYNLPINFLSPVAEDYEGLETKYRTFADNLDVIVDEFSQTYLSITEYLESLRNAIDVFISSNYLQTYQELSEIIIKLETIKTKLIPLSFVEEMDLMFLINNKELVLPILADIASLNNEIKTHFQSLITTFSPFAYHLSEFELIFALTDEFVNFVTLAQTLKVTLESLVSEIKADIENEVFVSDVFLLTFIKGLEEGSNDDPALIDALGLIVTMFSSFDFGDLDQLKVLFIQDEETNLRTIDLILFSFIEMNKGLTLPQYGQEISFYDSLTLLTTIEEMIEFIPDLKPYDSSLIKSFLSEENLPPSLIQFVVKQRPI